MSREAKVNEILDAVVTRLRTYFAQNPTQASADPVPQGSSILRAFVATADSVVTPALFVRWDSTEQQQDSATLGTFRSRMAFQVWVYTREGRDAETAEKELVRLVSDVKAALLTDYQLGGEDGVLASSGGMIESIREIADLERATLANVGVAILDFACNYDWQASAP